MGEKIKELRLEGKSYAKIAKELNCSKSVVAYHLAEGEKDKNRIRVNKNLLRKAICHKMANFNVDKKLKNKVFKFINKIEKSSVNFTYKDVINKFGEESECYLTGRKIKLLEPSTYHFDHIVSKNKGGKNTIENLGLLCPEANHAKRDMLVEDFIQLCKEVLEHNGYKVEKI